MSSRVGDVESVARIDYDGEILDSVEEVFERFYAPTRRMAREYPEVNDPNRDDIYRTGNFTGGELDRLEDKQQGELEKDVSVELFLEDREEPVEYSVRQINDNNKRYAANAPASLLLESGCGDRFVLQENKDYTDPSNGFHFGEGPEVEKFAENGSRGYISPLEFLEGIKSVYGSLDSTAGLSPLVPEIGVLESGEGYDPEAEHQMYYIRDFDEQAIEREAFPEVDKLAALANSIDVLGLHRMDSQPQEFLHGNGFLYESDLEKLRLVEDPPFGPDGRTPGLSRVTGIFHRVQSGADGSLLEMDGERVYSTEVRDAIEERHRPEDFDVSEIRGTFRDGVSEWSSENLEYPFIDLRDQS